MLGVSHVYSSSGDLVWEFLHCCGGGSVPRPLARPLAAVQNVGQALQVFSHLHQNKNYR